MLSLVLTHASCAVKKYGLGLSAQVIAEEAAAAGTSGKAPSANPLLLGRSVEEYVLETVRRVRPGDLEQALLVLPFSDALRLLQYLCSWLAAGTQVRGLEFTDWRFFQMKF